jgi:hypothetical protein
VLGGFIVPFVSLPGQKGGHNGGGGFPNEAPVSLTGRSSEIVTDATPATATVARIVTASILFINAPFSLVENGRLSTI